MAKHARHKRGGKEGIRADEQPWEGYEAQEIVPGTPIRLEHMMPEKEMMMDEGESKRKKRRGKK